MRVQFTLPEGKMVDTVGRDGLTKGQARMPSPTVTYENTRKERVTVTQSGEVRDDVPPDVFARAIKPYGLGVEVADKGLAGKGS